MSKTGVTEKIKIMGEICLEMIFPRKCVFCKKALPIKSYRELSRGIMADSLCGECRKNIAAHYVEEPFCLKCGKQLDSETKEYCGDCEKNSHIYDRGFAVFRYSDEIKGAVYRLKYTDGRKIGEFFGEEMVRRYGADLKRTGADVIMPVPIHKERRKRRGYNQAEEIGKRLSELTGIPMDAEALVRHRKTMPQKELEKESRKKNIENAFKVSRNIVKYNKVILVDDIYTTGATIDGCAAVLRKAGIKEIYFAAICIGAGV